MDTLINLVVEKAGISEEQAEVAVNTILDFLKDKLPGPVANQLEAAIEGKDIGGDLLKGAGGLFGKK